MKKLLTLLLCVASILGTEARADVIRTYDVDAYLWWVRTLGQAPDRLTGEVTYDYTTNTYLSANLEVGNTPFGMSGAPADEEFRTVFNSIAIDFTTTCRAAAGTLCSNGLSAGQFYELSLAPDRFHDGGNYSYGANGGPFRFLGQLDDPRIGHGGDSSVIGLYVGNGVEVPEPASLAIFAAGALGLCALRIRRLRSM